MARNAISLMSRCTRFRLTGPVQRCPHPPGTVERGFQVLAVALAHQGLVLLRGPLGTIVKAGAAEAQQRALRCRSPVGQYPFDKKSIIWSWQQGWQSS